MNNVEQSRFIEKFRRSLDMLNFIRTQSKQDKKAVANWGIQPDLQPGATRFLLTYIPTYFLDRFTPDQLREMRFFESIIKFVFYVITIGDDLLDNYGRVFTTGELEQRLDQARDENTHISLTSEDFLSRGITQKQLSSPRRLLLPSMAAVDKAQLIERFMHDVLDDNGMVDNMPFSEEEKQKLKRGFVNAFNFNFETYLQERKLMEERKPEELTLEDWYWIANIKAAKAFSSFSDVFALFTTRAPDEFQRIIEHGESLIMLAMYADDLKDFEIDWGRQENVIPIIARNYYLQEYDTLRQALDSGINFYGIRGNTRLIKSIPRTLLHWNHLYFSQLKKTREKELAISSFLSVPLNFTSIFTRRLSGTPMKDLPEQ